MNAYEQSIVDSIAEYGHDRPVMFVRVSGVQIRILINTYVEHPYVYHAVNGTSGGLIGALCPICSTSYQKHRKRYPLETAHV